jgi:hypothetical protein
MAAPLKPTILPRAWTKQFSYKKLFLCYLWNLQVSCGLNHTAAVLELAADVSRAADAALAAQSSS